MSEYAKTPAEAGVLLGGSDRRRSGDLSIFSRTLYQLSYRAVSVPLARGEPDQNSNRSLLVRICPLE